MSEFFNIVGFEFKKILSRKGVIISLTIVLLLTVLTCMMSLVGPSYTYESKWQEIVTYRDNARNLSGREINSELLVEASNAYSMVPDGDEYYKTPEYKKYARPYESILGIMDRYYEQSEMKSLTPERASAFYEIREAKLQEYVDNSSISDSSKAKLMALDKEKATPFIFEYIGGYTNFWESMYTIGILLTFVLGICLAPIFAGEYSSGIDQILLASKNGKHKLILAKIFTSFAFCFMITLAFSALSYLLSMIVFGFDGANATLQLYMISPYSFNMLGLSMVLFLCVMAGNIFMTTIIMLLSSRFKSASGVIIIVSILIMVPMLVNIDESQILLYNLFNLLPNNIMELWTIISNTGYEIAGLFIKPYIFLPIFAFVASIVLLPFIYKSFKNHQIG